MFQDSKQQSMMLAQSIFDLADQATTKDETELLCKVVGEVKPLLEATPVHPDLGLELMEFIDLKDDMLAEEDEITRAEIEAMTEASRKTVLDIIKNSTF